MPVKQTRARRPRGGPDDITGGAEEEQYAREQQAFQQGRAEGRKTQKVTSERAKTRRSKTQLETTHVRRQTAATQERAKTKRAKLASESRAARTDADREAARLRSQQSKERLAYQKSEAQRKQRARADANRNALFLTRGRSGSLSAPTTSSEGAALIPSGPSKSTSSKVILGAMVAAMVVIGIRNARQAGPSSTKVAIKGGAPLTVPSNLRAFAGVVVMGTIALVVNEIDPGLGMAFGILIFVDVGVGGIADNLARNLFGGHTTTPAPTPAGSHLGPIAFGPKGPSGFNQTLPGYNPNPSGGAAGPGGPTPFGSG